MTTENIDILDELREHYLLCFSPELEKMENYILQLENGDDFKENYNALYRAAHSLKGSGGTYGFTIITSVCHQLEDFLTDEFSQSIDTDKTKINTLFSYIDILKEAYKLLVAKKSDFSKIEKELAKIKKQNSLSNLHVLFIGSLKNMYGQICTKILEKNHVTYTVVRTIPAIQRLQHERFDVLITSQENKILNGTALIAAVKLNNKNRKMKYILLTSNSTIDIPKEIHPDFIVTKNSEFPEKLNQTIEIILSEA